MCMTATLVAKDVSGGYAHRVLFDHLDLTDDAHATLRQIRLHTDLREDAA